MSQLYPHIAQRDGEEQVFAYWLRSLNDRNFHFSQWGQASFQEPARSVAPGSYPNDLMTPFSVGVGIIPSLV